MRILRNDPTDSLPARAQVAVHNVRALVEQLQHDERAQRRWSIYALIAFAPAAALLGGTMMNSGEKPDLLAADRTRTCELAWWAARSGELERSLRDSGVPNPQIQKKIELERPYVMAIAKTECSSTANK